MSTDQWMRRALTALLDVAAVCPGSARLPRESIVFVGAPRARLRAATLADLDAVLGLWGHLFDMDDLSGERWLVPAREWFARKVDDDATARFPLIEVAGTVVATAIGTLELGVPNPQCLRGRTVRLANVFTVPEHRGRGLGTCLVHDIVEWARSIDADRVDLSATPEGQRIYERAGFAFTSAPRMKFML